MAVVTDQQEGIQLRERELRAILHISNMVGSVMELDDILKIIADTTAELMDAPVCSIFLRDGDGEELTLRATHGLNPAVVGQARFKMGEGIPGWVARNGLVVALKNGPADPRFSPVPGSEEEGYLGYLCAPLYIQTELIGAMTARKQGEYEFSPGEITLFETVCKQVAIVIEKSRLHREKIEAERLAAIGLSLSEISHYIKNVLQGVKGGAYFVDSGLSRDDLGRVKQGWETLKRSNRKIAYLVENMLSYSRTSNPRQESVSLNDLVIELLQSVEETARRRNIAIEPTIEPELPYIVADYEALYNAVLNLVTNAFDAIEEKGEGVLRVRLARGANRNSIVLTVEDTGCGIPPDIRKNIFNLFFSTKGSRGTGIGLAVTRKIIQEAGGTIAVDSTPGEGTTFTLTFPIAK